ncbi:MAG: VOC family protein [Parasphingopyxis sp.]|uniref:VOC family protein n=1 Tax=Parasphingopyxis sp. TaxID=1920299 RepID=UPI0032EB5954
MVLSLQHFALGVPDLKAGADFYTTFGLDMAEGQDKLAFRCEGRDHDEILLLETGKSRKFHHLSFATDQAGLDALKQRLEERDIGLMDPPAEDLPDGLWFHDTDGNLVNVHVGEPQLLEAEPVAARNSPGVFARKGTRGTPPPDQVRARPRKLGHMILFTPDVGRQRDFYTQVVGMKLSDEIEGEFAAFLRTAGDSDHHVLALLKSDAPGFHHASFEMGTIDEAALGAMRVREAGYAHAWGPGRHGVGSNYFHYFRDPWNGMAEFYFDMDFVPGDLDWEAQEWTKKDGMFLWSADGPPPPDFGKNYEAG